MQHVKRQFTPDVAMIDELYRKNARMILGYVRRQVGSLEEAEDIVLEVFAAALESEALTRLDERQQQAWLHRVAHNKCIDSHRRNTRRPTTSLNLLVEHVYEDDEREPEQIAMQQEEYRLLHEHLTLLTEQQREILRLKFAEDLRSPEIARRMNKSESAVRMMLARTLNALRTVYTRNEERRER